MHGHGGRIIDDRKLRVRARRAVVEAAHYRAIVDSLDEGIVGLRIRPGADPVAVTANPAARRILGLDPVGGTPAALHMSLQHVLDADGSPLSPEDFPVARALRSGRSVPRTEIQLVYPDGRRQWLVAGAHVVLSGFGEPIGITATFADVTAARLAGEALEAAHARAGALIEHGSDIITICDADGSITFASPACERVLGWRPEELVGRSILEWVHPGDRERVASIHAELLERPGGTTDYECRLVHRDGTWRHMEVIRSNRLDDPAIAGVVATKRDVTERVEAAERIHRQATHDSLTGLPNRVLLIDRLEAALARTHRGSPGCAVLYLDVDRFKTVNDSLGHAAGDRLLGIIGERLQAAIRPSDTVARIGGDEFVVLAEDVASEAQAVDLAERLRHAVAQPADVGARTVSVSASVGISLSDRHSSDALLQHADTALYRAKARGRNRWEIYDQAMRVVARLDLEMTLRRAIDDGRLVVNYQPVVDLTDGHLVGAEALVRLRTEDRRILGPDSFIGTAEESGLIVPLGSTVLRRACAQAAAWRVTHGDRRGHSLPVAVNLSARQLADPELTAEVTGALEEYGLEPDELSLELTESALIDAGSSTRRTVERLSAMGVRLALDDFGTGWSSLAYLRRFPISIIKIDRSFVKGLGHDRNDTEVVKAVIGLGSALDLTLVAEGIETEEQARTLAEMGCDHGQGFLFGRPVEPDDFRWLPGLEPDSG